MAGQHLGKRSERRLRYESREVLGSYVDAIVAQMPPNQSNFVQAPLASAHVPVLYSGEFTAMVKSSGQHPMRIADQLRDVIFKIPNSQKRVPAKLGGVILVGPNANRPAAQILDCEQFAIDRASIAQYALDVCGLRLHERAPHMTFGSLRNPKNPEFLQAAEYNMQNLSVTLASLTLQDTRWNAPVNT